MAPTGTISNHFENFPVESSSGLSGRLAHFKETQFNIHSTAPFGGIHSYYWTSANSSSSPPARTLRRQSIFPIQRTQSSASINTQSCRKCSAPLKLLEAKYLCKIGFVIPGNRIGLSTNCSSVGVIPPRPFPDLPSR